MGFPIAGTASANAALKGPGKITAIVVTVPISVAWSVSVYDALTQTGTPILVLGGNTGAAGTDPSLSFPFTFKGLELRNGLSYTLTNVSNITFEVE